MERFAVDTEEYLQLSTATNISLISISRLIYRMHISKAIKSAKRYFRKLKRQIVRN
jgi:hypothetical protein